MAELNFRFRCYRTPYLAAKGVPSHGLREAEDGWLLVPIQDADGKIWSLQHIARGGVKQFHPEGRLEGGHFVIGDTNQPGPLLIAEGYATAATVHALTGQPTVVAFNAGNLLPVAETYRSLFPERTIFIAGDNDHRRETEGKPNIGAQKSEQAAAATDGFTVLPLFENHETGSDWNDVVGVRGVEQARLQMQIGLAIAERETRLLSADLASDLESSHVDELTAFQDESADFSQPEVGR